MKGRCDVYDLIFYEYACKYVFLQEKFYDYYDNDNKF